MYWEIIFFACLHFMLLALCLLNVPEVDFVPISFMVSMAIRNRRLVGMACMVWRLTFPDNDLYWSISQNFEVIVVKVTAKIFKNGRSQAVRLPKEFRLKGNEVSIRKEGEKIILEPLEKTQWAEGFWEIFTPDPDFEIPKPLPAKEFTFD